MRYQAYTLANFRKIPQLENISENHKKSMEVVGNVLPFKANNYVINELIDWDNIPHDPIFRLTFPQQRMLLGHHYSQISSLLESNIPKPQIKQAADKIRLELNPHPAGQLEHNVPSYNGEKLQGVQHKYRETVLFFPSQGQTCHAYCSFCFRWPQFVGMSQFKFAMKEVDGLIGYLREHPEVTDVLFTGGDPMVMSAKIFGAYVQALLDANLPSLKTIRIGTKALSYWPYRFTSDQDADDMLRVFENVVNSGKHLALMAHFNHPQELNTEVLRKAVSRIRSTGAQIRTQSPILAHINDHADSWAKMWKEQANLGCIPYYMFIVRDTGAQHYFGIPLIKSWRIFREAYKQVSGIARTVRGPSMSATPGKVQVLGASEIAGEKVITLRMLQGRDPDWVLRPFFAKHDENAMWLDDLEPAFGEEQFFFELQNIVPKKDEKLHAVPRDPKVRFRRPVTPARWWERKGKA